MANQVVSTNKKWDFPALRQEFIEGNWSTVKEFLTEKQLPAYFSGHKGLSGVVREKEDRQREVLMRSAEKTLDKDVEDLTKVRLRQARLARFIQLRGAEALSEKSGLKITSVEDARKLLVSGLEQERKALGMDGGSGDKNLTQININTGPKTNLDRVLENAEYEELIELVAELKRLRTGRATPEIIEGSPSEAEEGQA